jgi:cullin 3
MSTSSSAATFTSPRKPKPKIKPARKKEDASTENLTKLSKAISQIQGHEASKLSFEEHYRYCYNLVLNKNGNLLHSRLSELIVNHLQREAKSKLDQVLQQVDTALVMGDSNQKVQVGERFLVAVKKIWDDHFLVMKKLRDVLKYMVSRL